MLALLPAALLSALTLDGSVHAEGRDGAKFAGQDPRAGAITLELNGRSSGPDAALLFGILPSGVLAEEKQVFARAYLGVDVRVGESGSLRLRQRGGYGTVDLSPVGFPIAPITGVGEPPTQGPGHATVTSPTASRFVFVQESNSSVELDVPATRRLRVLASGAWNVAGGADFAGRQALPLSRGPQARALLEWAATRLDTLRLEATGVDTRYSNVGSTRVSIATLTGGWRTLLSRSTEVSLAAGAGVGRASSEAPIATVSTLPYALGSADLRLTGLRDFSAVLGAAVEPVGDALSGDLVERASLRGSAVWGAADALAVTARVTGSVAVTSGKLDVNAAQSGDQYLQGELSLSVPLTRKSRLDLGARGSWLSRPLLNQPTRQWIAFLGYSAQMRLLP
jgi:hypothetical protein